MANRLPTNTNQNGPTFGFSLNRKKKAQQQDQLTSFAPPSLVDGAVQIPFGTYSAQGFTHSYILSMEAGVASDAELIERYRTCALYSKTDGAINKIINDMFVADENEPPVALDLDDIPEEELPERIRELMRDEFQGVIRLLDFNKRGYQIIRNWYVDSRLAFHKMVDPQRVKDGIQEMRQLDPRKIKFVKEVDRQKDKSGIEITTVRDEYFMYVDSVTTYNKTFSGYQFGDAIYNSGGVPATGNGVYRIHKDAVTFVHSGLVDPTTGIIYGYLQKAMKPFNQLRMMEDSLVVYRLARASERRIFYVNVGNIPPAKVEFYIKQLQNRYRNKITYDAKTGNITDQRNTLAMQEDYWIPRFGDGRGTQVETLPGGQHLDQIADIEYFKADFYGALNVPPGRFTADGAKALIGESGEISREELEFAKFISKLRMQFAELFLDVLKTQCVLRGVLTEEEWDEFEHQIKFKWARDSHFAENKDIEIWTRRLGILAEIDNAPFVGKYFTRNWVKKTILRFSEEEIEEMQKEMDEENAELGEIATTDPISMIPPDQVAQMTIQQQQQEEQAEADAQAQAEQAKADAAAQKVQHAHELKLAKAKGAKK